LKEVEKVIWLKNAPRFLSYQFVESKKRNNERRKKLRNIGAILGP
jgi:hypothetical protein